MSKDLVLCSCCAIKHNGFLRPQADKADKAVEAPELVTSQVDWCITAMKGRSIRICRVFCRIYLAQHGGAFEAQ